MLLQKKINAIQFKEKPFMRVMTRLFWKEITNLLSPIGTNLTNMLYYV